MTGGVLVPEKEGREAVHAHQGEKSVDAVENASETKRSRKSKGLVKKREKEIVIEKENAGGQNPEIETEKENVSEREGKDVKRKEVKGWNTLKLMMVGKYVLRKNPWMIIQIIHSINQLNPMTKQMLSLKRMTKRKYLGLITQMVVVLVVIMTIMKRAKLINCRCCISRTYSAIIKCVELNIQ